MADAATVDREELAWAGGFFDGEGYAGTYLNKNRKNVYPRLTIDIRQCDREVLDRFKEAVFGIGKVSGPYGPYGHDSAKTRPHWFYQASGFRNVAPVLAALWPFIGSVKRQQLVGAVRRFRTLRNI